MKKLLMEMFLLLFAPWAMAQAQAQECKTPHNSSISSFDSSGFENGLVLGKGSLSWSAADLVVTVSSDQAMLPAQRGWRIYALYVNIGDIPRFGGTPYYPSFTTRLDFSSDGSNHRTYSVVIPQNLVGTDCSGFPRVTVVVSYARTSGNSVLEIVTGSLYSDSFDWVLVGAPERGKIHLVYFGEPEPCGPYVNYLQTYAVSRGGAGSGAMRIVGRAVFLPRSPNLIRVLTAGDDDPRPGFPTAKWRPQGVTYYASTAPVPISNSGPELSRFTTIDFEPGGITLNRGPSFDVALPADVDICQKSAKMSFMFDMLLADDNGVTGLDVQRPAWVFGPNPMADVGTGSRPYWFMMGNDPNPGCVKPAGYYKIHNALSPKLNQREPWPISENTQICGISWLTALQTKSTNTWYLLAGEWFGAMLNIANGSLATPAIDDVLDAADRELTTHCRAFGKTTDDWRFAQLLAGYLENYNLGQSGVPGCPVP